MASKWPNLWRGTSRHSTGLRPGPKPSPIGLAFARDTRKPAQPKQALTKRAHTHRAPQKPHRRVQALRPLGTGPPIALRAAAVHSGTRSNRHQGAAPNTARANCSSSARACGAEHKTTTGPFDSAAFAVTMFGTTTNAHNAPDRLAQGSSPRNRHVPPTSHGLACWPRHSAMGPHIHADPPAQQHPLAKQQKKPKVPHARTPTSSKHRAENTLKNQTLA